MDAKSPKDLIITNPPRATVFSTTLQGDRRTAPDRVDLLPRLGARSTSRPTASSTLRRQASDHRLRLHGWKDTSPTSRRPGNSSCNFVTKELAEAMNRTSAQVAPRSDKINLAGLTPRPAGSSTRRASPKARRARMPADPDHPAAGRQRRQGAGLADARRSGRRPHRQGDDQGRRLPDRDGPPDRARRPAAATISRSSRKTCSR